MSIGFIFQTVLELVMAAAVIFAVLREDTLIKLEEKIALNFRSRRAQKKALIIKTEDSISHCA